MRYFEYLGNHPETSLYGVRFRVGEPTPVDPEVHPVLARKLAGNSHFRESFAEPAAQPAAPALAGLEQQVAKNAEALDAAIAVAHEAAEVAQPKRRGRPPKSKK